MAPPGASNSRLVQALECPICKGPFVTPVSVGCGHCFCSRCIRDALGERKECPVCREVVKEASIRRERCVEEVMGAWSDISAEFTRFLEAGPSFRPSKRKTKDLPSGIPKRPRIDIQNGVVTQSSISRGTATTSKDKSGRVIQTIVLDDDDEEEDGRIEALDIEHNNNNEYDEEEDDDDEVYALPPSGQSHYQSNLIPCPACGRSVPFSKLNTHLDRSCRSSPPPPPGGGNLSKTSNTKSAWAKLLPGTAGEDPATTTTHTSTHQLPVVDMTRKISKLNYHLATPKELRAVLELYGCSTTGEKAVLIERVQLWISIFNSNLDASHPKPLKFLRSELNEQERAKARDKDDAQKAKQVFATIRHADDDDEAFKRLEADLRLRRKSAKNGNKHGGRVARS